MTLAAAAKDLLGDGPADTSSGFATPYFVPSASPWQSRPVSILMSCLPSG